MKVRVPLITLTLVIANAGLVVALGWRLMEGSRRADLVAGDAAALETSFPSMEASPGAPLDTIQSRAIFHRSRTFHVAPPVPQVVQPPPDYRLAGSMSVAGKQSAVLIHSQTGARVRVSMGEQLEGWTVAAIELGIVKVQLGDRIVEISAASRRPGTEVTLASGQQPTPQAAAQNGVRVIGNSAGRVAQPRPVLQGPSNQPPRLYRPPQPQTHD